MDSNNLNKKLHKKAKTIFDYDKNFKYTVDKKRPHLPIRSTWCPRTGNRQILLWNPIAILRNHFDNDNGCDDFLVVDFQDAAVNSKLIYWHRVRRYELGDVNRHALLMISRQFGEADPNWWATDKSCANNEDNDSSEDEEEPLEPALVHVRPLGKSSWSEWNVLLPRANREKVVGCCLVGQMYAIVMTQKCVRYFMANAGGIQAYVESIHGNPIAIASSSSYLMSPAGPSDNLIRVVIVSEVGHRLMWRMDIYKATDKPVKWTDKGKWKAVVATTEWHPLPLSALKWIGFSDSGELYTVDSKQCVRRLHIDLYHTGKIASQPRWTPVLNLRTALLKELRKSDRYFPIGVLDRANRCCFLAVQCRGSRYPAASPWQQGLATLEFQLPLCAGGGGGGPSSGILRQTENQFLVNQQLSNWNDSTSISLLRTNESDLLMKLFQNAIGLNQDRLAFDIGTMMPNSQVMKLAVKCAARNNREDLAEKMGELAHEEELEEQHNMAVYARSLVASHRESPAIGTIGAGGDGISAVAEEEQEESTGQSNQQPASTNQIPNPEFANIWEEFFGDKPQPVAKAVAKEDIKQPFKTFIPKPVSRLGLKVIDEMVRVVPPVKSPKKIPNPFGKFVPLPSPPNKKRKSQFQNGSTLDKYFKKQ